MSKLIDLIAQQRLLEKQIEDLKEDREEAEALEFAQEIEALRNKYQYIESYVVEVVHSLYQVKIPAETGKSVSDNAPKAPKEPAEKWKVRIDGVDVVLKESNRGIMKEDLEKVVKAAGFTKYKDYIADLIKKNNVKTFDDLIKKLKGVPVTA
jgi:hypothetical protein